MSDGEKTGGQGEDSGETAIEWLRSHLPPDGDTRTMEPTDLRCVRQAIAGLLERDELLRVLEMIEVACDHGCELWDELVDHVRQLRDDHERLAGWLGAISMDLDASDDELREMADDAILREHPAPTDGERS